MEILGFKYKRNLLKCYYKKCSRMVRIKIDVDIRYARDYFLNRLNSNLKHFYVKFCWEKLFAWYCKRVAIKRDGSKMK